jgi:hypothetical protein
MVVDGGPFSMSVGFRKQVNKEGMMPLVVGEALSVLLGAPGLHRVHGVQWQENLSPRSSA